MKISLAFCVVICVIGVYSDPILKKRAIRSEEEKTNECLSKTKLDRKILDEAVKSMTIPDTPEMHCFLACTMKQEGVMNDDGTFTKSFRKTEGGNFCKDLSGKDECELAYKTADCLRKNNFKK